MEEKDLGASYFQQARDLVKRAIAAEGEGQFQVAKSLYNAAREDFIIASRYDSIKNDPRKLGHLGVYAEQCKNRSELIDKMPRT